MLILLLSSVIIPAVVMGTAVSLGVDGLKFVVKKSFVKSAEIVRKITKSDRDAE